METNQKEKTISAIYDKKNKSHPVYGTSYYTKKKVKQLSAMPKIKGAIGKGVKQYKGNVLLEHDVLPYYQRKYHSFFYKVEGYILCEQNSCIAVITRRKLPLFLFLLCVSLGLFLFYRNSDAKQPVIEENAVAYVPKEEIPSSKKPNRIVIPGFNNLKMRADTDMLYAVLWNPENNKCYFTFRILLKENNEVLYQSDLVPPGSAIKKEKLTKKLKKGTYIVLIQMEAYQLQDSSQRLNGGTSETILQVVS